MTNENTKTPPPSAQMVEDKEAERRKQRDRERGLVTIDANGKKTKESSSKKGESK